jgi:hypothetical protein
MAPKIPSAWDHTPLRTLLSFLSQSTCPVFLPPCERSRSFFLVVKTSNDYVLSLVYMLTIRCQSPRRFPALRRSIRSWLCTRIVFPRIGRSRSSTYVSSPSPSISVPRRTPILTSTSHRLALFGIYYSPHGLNGTSEITMGGVDFSKFTTTLDYASVISDADGAWTIACTGGSVNGQTPDLLKDGFNILFDSGTPNVVLPQDMAEVRKSRFHRQNLAIQFY